MLNKVDLLTYLLAKLRRRIGGQMMADLPKDRFEEAPPFTYCAVDMFGPFTVRVKRSNMNIMGQRSLALLTELSILRLHKVLILTHPSKH